MKRHVALRAKLPPRRPVKTIEYTPRPRVAPVAVAGPARASVPVPKKPAVRSKAVLLACREIPCQACGVQDGTVCAAHANWADYGKGLARKADDTAVAALCSVCHSDLDQGLRMTKAERRAMWEEAHRKTVEFLQALGRWPLEAE